MLQEYDGAALSQPGAVTGEVLDSSAEALLSLTEYNIDGVLLRTWFDRETWIPVTAEFVNGNAVVITCVFRDVADTAA